MSFCYLLSIPYAVRTPQIFLLVVWPLPRSLATTSGISVDFFSSPYLDVSVQAVPHIRLFDSPYVDRFFICRVSPFGYPRVAGCFRLAVAFRRSLRPSSAPGAKAFPLRSYSLDHFLTLNISTYGTYAPQIYDVLSESLLSVSAILALTLPSPPCVRTILARITWFLINQIDWVSLDDKIIVVFTLKYFYHFTFTCALFSFQGTFFRCWILDFGFWILCL